MTSPAVIALASMENQCLAFPRQPRVENQRRDARWNVRAEKTKEHNVTLDRASQPNDTFSSPSLCLGPNPTQSHPSDTLALSCVNLFLRFAAVAHMLSQPASCGCCAR